MKPIQLPPTRTDVVKETMKRSIDIANTVKQRQAFVTNDLAIAKITKRIQSEESPVYDNLFIMFGSFHIELSFFSSLGKFIEGSGGPYILSECDIVAMGSMNKFLKGKMYNRCRRGNMILAVSMEGLHFERFLNENYFDDKEAILEELEAYANTDQKNISEKMKSFIDNYEEFQQQTLSGLHGKTARYWMIYIYYHKLYLLLHHAMKINDVKLFGYVLLQICPIFFMTNHHNYSRWMTLYALELLNLENKNPEVELQLRSGGFSVNRSGRKFSNVGVDMALEQTINAEAKNRLKGIIGYADISSAVNRWITTNSMRSEIVNNVLEVADLDKPIDGTKELRAPRIAKDKEDVQKVKKLIRDTLNPFDKSTNVDALFNIRTGRKLEIEGETYLLTSVNEGVNIRDKFIEECQNNPQRFEEAVTKQMISKLAIESFFKKRTQIK